jgi:multiple sugar transport system substrate-binding protein
MKFHKMFMPLILLIALLIGVGFSFYSKLVMERPKRITIDPTLQINPDKEYSITVWDYAFPGKVGEFSDYNEFIKAVIAEFRKIYPNINISFRLFDADKLQDSLHKEGPPDLLCAPYLLDPDENRLMFPIGLFLNESEKANYEVFPLEAVMIDNMIWALPRWISPTIWLGNAKLLGNAGVNLDGVLTKGWTWEEFYNILVVLEKKTSHTSTQEYGLILPYYPLWLFQDLILNNGFPTMLSTDGQFLWDEASVIDTASFLKQLQKTRGFCREPAPFYGRILHLMLTDKIAIMGRANLPLLKELADSSRELLPLPIPHNSGKEWYIQADVFYVSLFRNKREKGDDHLKAAAEFGKFLTTGKAAALGGELGFLPASRLDQEAAIKSMNLSPSAEAFLYTCLSHGVTSINLPRELQEKEEEFTNEVLLPAVKELLEEKSSLEEFTLTIVDGGKEKFAVQGKTDGPFGFFKKLYERF